MSKKVIFNKRFTYSIDHKDDLRFSRYISSHGELIFSDLDWRLYDDGTTAMVGINKERHSEANYRCKLINLRKFKFTK